MEAPECAVVVEETLRVLAAEITVLDLLEAQDDARERLAARVQAEHPLGHAALLAPIEPATIRDFSVFEQHVEGVVRNADPDAQRPGGLVRVARSATSPTRTR